MDQARLSEIRKRWDLTQAEMAELMEVSSALIVSQWENGFRNPSGIVKKLYRLLDELPKHDAKRLLEWLAETRLEEGERRRIKGRKAKSGGTSKG